MPGPPIAQFWDSDDEQDEPDLGAFRPANLRRSDSSGKKVSQTSMKMNQKLATAGKGLPESAFLSEDYTVVRVIKVFTAWK